MFKFQDCTIDNDCNDDNECTIDACLSDISTCAYAETDCYECSSLIQIDALTDFHPYEITFDIMDSNNKTIMNGGPCATSHNYHTTSQCLPFGLCQFNMYDDFKGICCNFGDGIYTLSTVTTSENRRGEHITSCQRRRRF